MDEDSSNKNGDFYVNILNVPNTSKGFLTVTSMPQTSETGLVARAQNGDRNAFGELVRGLNVYGYKFRLVEEQ